VQKIVKVNLHLLKLFRKSVYSFFPDTVYKGERRNNENAHNEERWDERPIWRQRSNGDETHRHVSRQQSADRRLLQQTEKTLHGSILLFFASSYTERLLPRATGDVRI